MIEQPVDVEKPDVPALEAQRDLSLRLAPRPLEEVLLMADFLGVPYGGDRGSELLWLADAALCSALPLGWAAHVTDDGTPYYVNSNTGATSWDRPSFDNRMTEDL